MLLVFEFAVLKGDVIFTVVVDAIIFFGAVIIVFEGHELDDKYIVSFKLFCISIS